MASALEKAVDALAGDPSSTALLLDFDGTLAPIVDDPAAAVPLPGVAEVLASLARSYGVVAVISGRPVSHLRQHLQPGPRLVGLYGLETVLGDEIIEDDAVAGWRPVFDEVAATAATELPAGVIVENKGLSLTLHVRTHPEHATVVEEWARSAGARWGLRPRAARMSVELHPPVDVDKGTVVSNLVADMRAACFIGDDLGDVPAFEALRRFSDEGGTIRRVVVSSTEMAPALVALADLVIPDPNGVLSFLQALDRAAP